MTAEAESLQWVESGRGFLSSACGRFDLVWCAVKGVWVAVDAEAGRVFRSAYRAECVLWCRKQLKGRRQWPPG